MLNKGDLEEEEEEDDDNEDDDDDDKEPVTQRIVDDTEPAQKKTKLEQANISNGQSDSIKSTWSCSEGLVPDLIQALGCRIPVRIQDPQTQTWAGKGHRPRSSVFIIMLTWGQTDCHTLVVYLIDHFNWFKPCSSSTPVTF